MCPGASRGWGLHVPRCQIPPKSRMSWGWARLTLPGGAPLSCLATRHRRRGNQPAGTWFWAGSCPGWVGGFHLLPGRGRGVSKPRWSGPRCPWTSVRVPEGGTWGRSGAPQSTSRGDYEDKTLGPIGLRTRISSGGIPCSAPVSFSPKSKPLSRTWSLVSL